MIANHANHHLLRRATYSATLAIRLFRWRSSCTSTPVMQSSAATLHSSDWYSSRALTACWFPSPSRSCLPHVPSRASSFSQHASISVLQWSSRALRWQRIAHRCSNAELEGEYPSRLVSSADLWYHSSNSRYRWVHYPQYPSPARHCQYPSQHCLHQSCLNL